MTHGQICKQLNDMYKAKNSDYGDSFHRSFTEFGLTAALVRISDKYYRAMNLLKGGSQKVNNESVRDTLLDLANYCIMTVQELDEKGEQSESY